MLYKRILSSMMLMTLFGGVLSAQTEEDFVKIAKRTMTDNKKAKEVPGEWHGAVYVGASSRGVSNPNAFFNYKHGKWALDGELGMTMSRLNTEELEEIVNNNNSSTTQENFNIESRTHQNLKLGLKFTPNKQHTWSLEVSDRYRKDNVETSIEKIRFNEEQKATYNLYEVKTMDSKDLNLGAMTQYKFAFNGGGSISARMNFNYNNKPTDVDYKQWSVKQAQTTSFETQEYRALTPKGQLAFQSPEWGGFSFSVKEDVGLLSTKVNNSTTNVDFTTNDLMTSGEANYKYKGLALRAFAAYDYYDQTIEIVDESKKPKTYNDWQFGGSVSQKIGKNHSLKLSYDNMFVRPSYMQLYPLVHVGTSGVSTPRKGNPDLDPSKNYTIKLQYGLKMGSWKIETTGSYKNITNDISKVSMKDESGKKFKTWINDAEHHIFKLALDGEVKSGPFEMTMGAHVQHLDYKGAKVTNDNAWSFSFKARPKVRLPKNWTVAGVMTYTGKENHQYYYNRANFYLALRAQKVIGNWAVYGFVQDIAKGEYTEVLVADTYTNTKTNEYHSRALILGCSYQF